MLLKYKLWKKIPIITLIFILFSGWSFELLAAGNERINLKTEILQQSRTITGVVFDKDGAPLTGATVYIAGTTIGTITDADGRYRIQVAEGNNKLSFSFIGFITTTVEIGGRTTLNVTLKGDLTEIDEVVVIGYGTAKKRDLVGAVDQITSKSLEGRSNPSITRSLQGQIPNLNITIVDGKPTRGATYNVRGQTSIGAGGSALILIDGVEGDPNTINPQDVESVSVLKDASSAAVYGARGTFGVVLITTKKAIKGSMKVSYDGSKSFFTRTVEPSFVTNGYEWTTSMLNSYKGYVDYTADPVTINNIFPFSRSWYEELKRRNDNPELPKVRVTPDGRYEYFGNTDWNKLLYKDWTQGNEHKLSINGGDEKSSYYLSGRYFSQDGIYRYNSDDLERLNFRAKGQLKISPKFSVENNFSIDNMDYNYPLISYTYSEVIQRNLEHQGYPVAMLSNPDGTNTYSSVYNGIGDFRAENSSQQQNTLNIRNTVGFNYTPVTDILTFRGDFTYSYKDYQETRIYRPAIYSEGPGLLGEKGYSERRMWSQETNYLASNLTGNFTPKLGENHTVNILLGGNVESSTRRNLFTSRDGFLYPDKPNYLLMDGINYAIEERSIDWAFVGIFLRANYSYKGKYLFEFSTRYDGSSKFPVNEQWGIFPSASAAWRISDEGFMAGTKSWLDNLKIRISAGTLGNGNVDPYSFSELMNVSKTATLLNGGFQSYTSLPNLVPDNLTWEKATTYDIGFDADMFKGKFNVGFDWYRRNTTDMYIFGPDLPQVLGTGAPKGNYADLKTNGWEVSIGWKNRVKIAGNDLSYNAKLMVWDSESYITKYLGNEAQLLSSYYAGQRIGDIWGYTIDGLFSSADEIAAHADQSKLPVSVAKILLPGDLKFRDINNDGEIYKGANTLSDHGDLTIIGNSEQRYHFGLNLGTNYKGIGASAFFQGVGKRDWYPDIESGYFYGQYNRHYGYYPTDQIGNTWIEGENEDPNAYWPRQRTYLANSTSKPMGVANNRYLQNAAYVRLKSISVDYTLPEKWTSKIKLSSVKIYFTGENLWTWTALTKHTTNFDPEVITSGDADIRSRPNVEDGYSYPMLKSYTVGLNVTF